MNTPLMFTLWIRNDTTGESTQIKGQGSTVPEALKDGWDNACADFGTSSSGAPPLSKARLRVRLPSGESVWRSPAKFASRQPYEPAEAKEHEIPEAKGDAAKPFAQLVDEGKAEWKKSK